MRSPSWPIAVAAVLFASAAQAQTFTVTATTDANPTGLGVGSGASGDLRYCIHQANALSLSGQAVTINFNLPANSTIALGSNILPPLNPGRNGQLGANGNSLLIDGSTATGLTIDGGNSGYGIFMAYSGNIKIQNLTLANGLAKGGIAFAGGGGLGAGGGILVNNLANLTAQGMAFSNTRAQGGTGGGGTTGGGGGGTNGGNGGFNTSGEAGGGGLGGSARFSNGIGGGGVGASGGTASNSSPGAGGAGQFTGGAPGGTGGGPNGAIGGAMGGGGGGSVSTGGGGGGGVGGGNSQSGAGGAGGFGGGGGGSGSAHGGDGGDFGGGGGPFGRGGYGGGGGDAGAGGFGGGGGVGLQTDGPISAGFGGGQGFGGFAFSAGGGGGMGAGGAAFVRAGGTLTLIDPVFAGTISATGGAASGGAAGAGQGIGQGVFLGGATTLAVSGTNTLTLGTDFLGGGNDPDAQGALIKTGTGTLAINGMNSYAGGTIVSAGTLTLGHAQAAGLGTVTVNSGGTLALNTSAQVGGLAGSGPVNLNSFRLTVGSNNTTTTFSGSMSGSGGLTKVGLANLILGSPNSCAGGTTISGGTLTAANSTGSATGPGGVTVGNGGTLGGGNGGTSFSDSTQGFIGGAVTVQSGGTIMPGSASAGVLTVNGGVNFQSASSLYVRLGSHNIRPGPSPTDVNTNGRLATPLDILFGGSLTATLDANGQSYVLGRTYDYFVGQDDGVTHQLPSSVTVLPVNFAIGLYPTGTSLSRSADGKDLILSFTITNVPEPGSLALLAVAAAAGWRLRRRAGSPRCPAPLG